MRFVRLIFLGALAFSSVQAETGYDGWLRYAPLDRAALARYRDAIPAVIFVSESSPQLESAENELIRGLRGMLGRTLRTASGVPGESAILLGTVDQLHRSAPQLQISAALEPGAYWLKSAQAGRVSYLVVTGAAPRDVLYGAFALLRKIALGEPVAALDEKQAPYAPIRWVNQWDNLDGSIERGYGGRSIFWDSGHARADLSRVNDYGRMLASLGINGCTVNNVNAAPAMLAPDLIAGAARIAAALRPWGVQVSLAVDFGSPKTLGGLDTFDPLDPRVVRWWREKADEIYLAIPDFAGFVLKADSEGRVGPATYGRTHADAANVLARAVRPHGGVLLYRGFVYNHHMDWRNAANDRARAAYDNFKPLDGQFDDNVIIQIKNGPIDFQAREPASPLFGALEKTNVGLELQITQEYSGQGRDLVFLVPQWKETLDFDMRARGSATPVKALAAGKIFGRPTGGFIGVANVGLDENWLGNHLSMANLYGFGRLAWNPNLTAARIVDEWTRLTFGSDPRTVQTIAAMQLGSWRAYEGDTGPLGLQTLTDIVGNHFGVSVEASEKNGWGQWHRADKDGVGMDRTTATGTGYIGQYQPAVARLFESLALCPDNLLLFMHHVPYTHRLHSGETVIQHIYDSHYAGASVQAGYAAEWESLRGSIDEQRFNEVLAQLRYESGRSRVWRDAVCNWFFRESGIPDEQGRVGHHPNRHEAESLQLTGYSVVDVSPWEAASGGKAVSCPVSQCGATLDYRGASGWFTLTVQYFDQKDGVSHFRLFVNNQLIDRWAAADNLPTTHVDGSSSTERVIPGIALRPGDQIRIEGAPDGPERAPLDYIEITP